jgi:hypothetical protein
MEHIGKLILSEQGIYQSHVIDTAVDEPGSRRYVVSKPAREVVEHHHFVTQGKQLVGDVGAYKARTTGH